MDVVECLPQWFATLFFETWCLPEPETISLAGLVSMTLGSICLHPPPKQQGCTTAFDFDMTARDLNVGALAFTVSTLPTKPFPRSRFFFIY